MTWIRIAERQSRSVPEAKKSNPSSHVPIWEQYFHWEDTEKFSQLYHYLARITLELMKIRTKDHKDVDYERLLMKFNLVEPKPVLRRRGKKGEMTPEAYRRMQKSKSHWGSFLSRQKVK